MADCFDVPGKKSTYHAKKFLNSGNAKLKKQKYFEALENFNKSLCLAEPTEIFSAHLGRSEVYREVNEIEKFLENKRLAVGPKPRLQVVESFEENISEASQRDPWKFFKLSYPSNAKIPFVANCLELKNDESFGRYIITSRDLKPGDIIAIEEPFFKIVNSSASHMRCANCLKSNQMNLRPSKLTSSAMFCSSLCAEAGMTFHQAEVTLRCIDFTQRILLEALSICNGSFDKLLTLIDDPTLSSKTIFDFDWNDTENVKNRMHGLLAFNSLQLGPISDDLDYCQTHPVLALFKSEREKDIGKAFMVRIARILTVNCYCLDWMAPQGESDGSLFLSSTNRMEVGSSILIFGSLFNHSCAPNIDRTLVDNKFVFVVRRPIWKGEQLFISYGPSFIREPNDSRQVKLKAHFDFLCSCEACHKQYPVAYSHAISTDKLKIKDGLIKSTGEWEEEFKKNCQLIADNHSKFPSHWLCRIMDRNLFLLAAIARNEPFIF